MSETGHSAAGSADKLRRELQDLGNACIHCGLCLPVCPTYRETGNEAESPRGRLYLMRALVEGRIEPGPDPSSHLDACVGCRACETACPAGVAYGGLLERARALYVEPHRETSARTLFWRPIIRHVLPYRGRMAAFTLPARVARALLVRKGRAPGWLPAPIRRSLEVLPAGGVTLPLSEWTPALGAERGVVAVLEGCAAAVLYGAANHATVRMLARAGYRVWVPPKAGCCGAIQAHDGDRPGAQARAIANLQAFDRPDLVAIISNAGGCGAALHEMGDLLSDDPVWSERAKAFSAKVQDFSSFLAAQDLPPPTKVLNAVVTYHDPCHLAHGLGVREAPRRLLKALPGVQFVELEEADWCCGGAGSYALLQPELSDNLLAHKIQHVLATGATILVTQNPPCLMQIGRGLEQSGHPVQLLHLATLLDSLYQTEG
jgi:glycolate oxidase iron-sulfur subunit